MARQAVHRAERYLLSHSGDHKWVAVLVAKIMYQHGIPFWLDVLHCQDRNDVAIFRAVEKCECIVVISSRSYNTSKWCQKELKHARQHNKRIECLRLERNDEGELYYENLPGTDLPKKRPVKVQEAINDFFSKFVKSNLTPGEIRQLPRWIEYLKGLQEHGELWTMDLVLDNIGLEVVPPDPFSIPQEQDLEIGRRASGSQRNHTDQVAGAVAVEQVTARVPEAAVNATERQTKSCAVSTRYLYCLFCLVVHILPLVIFLGIWFSRPGRNSLPSTGMPIESNFDPSSGSSSEAPFAFSYGGAGGHVHLINYDNIGDGICRAPVPLT